MQLQQQFPYEKFAKPTTALPMYLLHLCKNRGLIVGGNFN